MSIRESIVETVEAKVAAVPRVYVVASILVVGMVLGLLIGWRLWRPSAPVIEGPAAAVALPKTGAIAIERDPKAAVPPKVSAAAKELNPKAKLTRAATLTVQPTQVGCAPVTVDLGTVAMPDHTERLVARSDGATITGGIDIPIATAQVVKEMKWAAGASYSPVDRAYGVFIDRDLGPFRLSAELRQSTAQGVTAVFRAGVRF